MVPFCSLFMEWPSYLNIRELQKGPVEFFTEVLESRGKVQDFFVTERVGTLSEYAMSVECICLVQEPLAAEAAGDEANGAAGGRDLRQGVTALMDVMRDLLNSIRFIPPPVENAQPDADDAAAAADDDDDDVDNDDWQWYDVMIFLLIRRLPWVVIIVEFCLRLLM